MANATKYVDNVNGNNGNTGDSEAQAYADLATAIGAITGGGNTIHLQAGSNYVYTAAEAFPVGLKGDLTDGRNRIIGYTTTPGAADGRPVITSATNSVNHFAFNDNDYWEFKHLKFSHTAATRGCVFSVSTSGSIPLFFTDCVFDGLLSVMGTNTFSGSIIQLTLCEVMNCTSIISALHNSSTATSGVYRVIACDFHDNAGPAIRHNSTTGEIYASDTIFDSNGGAAAIHASNAAGALTITAYNCVFVDNTGSGIQIAASSVAGPTLDLSNNVFYGNGAYGFENLDEQISADTKARLNRNNAFGSNTSGARTGLSAGDGDVTLTADPFTNKTGRDFSLNNVAGGGAALRAAGFPSAFVSGTTTSYPDIGVAQHEEVAAAGGDGADLVLLGGPSCV